MKQEKKRQKEKTLPDWTIETVLKEEGKHRKVTKKEIPWNKENREIYPVKEKCSATKVRRTHEAEDITREHDTRHGERDN